MILSHAGLVRAKTIVITSPDQQGVERTISNALKINPSINIIARVHHLSDSDLFRGLGVKELISPEYQASLEILKRTLALSGCGINGIDEAVGAVDRDDDVKADEGAS